MEAMLTTISNLPRDLIEDIISRVSRKKDMKAVRLTCKSWNSLLKSESFMKMHINKATRETMIMAGTCRNVYLMSVVDQFKELKGTLSFFYNQVNLSRISHYEGLLLCILEEEDTRILVLNPYLEQTRWIDLRYSYRPYGYDMFNYALGYEDKESCRSVKLMRFLDFNKRAQYEIYDFDSGLWTTLNVNPHWYISWNTHSVSLKGNTYWCAKERNLKKSFVYHLICFDFTTEKFGPLLPLPSCARDRGVTFATLSCVKEDKLAVLFEFFTTYESEIWITTKIEAEMVSWSRFLRIDKLYEPYSFVIDEEKKVYMAFILKCSKPHSNIIGEDGHLIKTLDIEVPEEINYYSYIFPYVPSLVQIKERAREAKEKHKAV